MREELKSRAMNGGSNVFAIYVLTTWSHNHTHKKEPLTLDNKESNFTVTNLFFFQFDHEGY
jgi:hypothetical protein